MQTVTFSVDEDLIERARFQARSQKTTLNAAFHEWLVQYTAGGDNARKFDEPSEQSKLIRPNAFYSRNERNNR